MSASVKITRSRMPLLGNPAQITAAVVATSTAAWLIAFLMHGSAVEGWYHAPADLLGTSSSDWFLYLHWLGGWSIMVVAMMLPPALPFLQAMARLADGLAKGRLVATAALAFIASWVLVGFVLVVAGHLLANLLADMTWLDRQPALVSGLAAIFAGLYQLSPLKQACLTACRTPTGMLLVSWKPDRPWRSAIAVAIRYAAVCIGCCWTLMLLTLVVGAFALPLMVLVSAIMLLERLLPSVRPLIPLQAALACAIGILLFFGSLPPGLGWG